MTAILLTQVPVIIIESVVLVLRRGRHDCENGQLHMRIAPSQAGWLFGVAFQQRFNPDGGTLKVPEG